LCHSLPRGEALRLLTRQAVTLFVLVARAGEIRLVGVKRGGLYMDIAHYEWMRHTQSLAFMHMPPEAGPAKLACVLMYKFSLTRL